VGGIGSRGGGYRAVEQGLQGGVGGGGETIDIDLSNHCC
jgi:hypothetical protein